MKQSRIVLLAELYLATVLIFVCQKPLFMLYNHSIDSELCLSDCFEAVWHGLPLDFTTAGYFIVIPLLVLSVSYFKGFSPRQLLFPYYAIVSLIESLVFVADTVMYSFWKFKLDTTVFLYTDKPADAAASVSLVFMLLCLIAVVAMTAFILWIYYKLLPSAFFSPGKRLRVLVMLPVIALLFIVMRGGLSEGTANVSSVYYSNRQFLNHSAVNPVFNMFYSMSHQQDFSKEYHYYSESQCKALTKGIYNTESIDTQKIISCHRPNIILITWEGCGSTMVGCLGGDSRTSPNTDALAQEGVLFSNCIANSFRTDRGLVSINCGWLGFPTASLMRIPEKSGSLPGIAKTLHKNGYTTDFWYGGDIKFTNMGAFMLDNGYQKTFSVNDFSKKENTSKWGVPDDILFEHILKSIKGRGSAKPWFTSIMTLSSHEPWKVPYNRLAEPEENSFAYTDHCIGRFISELKKLPSWKNTLIIITADHGAITKANQTFSTPAVMHIPLIFCGGAVKNHQVISLLMNQSDIAATLLGQLDINHKDFIFSRDVMSKSYTYPTAIHTSKIEESFYDPTGMTTVDLVDDKIIDTKGSGGKESSIRKKKGKAILQLLYQDMARR